MSIVDFGLPGVEVQLLPDASAVAAQAARTIVAEAEAAVAGQGSFRICLAGGTTPTAAYRLLARADAEWSAWWVYHGDERCLPEDDPERNSLTADAAWLNQVAIPRDQVFPIPAHLGAETAAEAYQRQVQRALPFDVVLLGMGEDGHTASLFPGRPVPEDRLAIPVHNSPKPPPDRVSLTATALTDTVKLFVLVTGSGKAEAVRRWRQGDSLPVARVSAAARATVLIDRAAADLG